MAQGICRGACLPPVATALALRVDPYLREDLLAAQACLCSCQHPGPGSFLEILERHWIIPLGTHWHNSQCVLGNLRVLIFQAWRQLARRSRVGVRIIDENDL